MIEIKITWFILAVKFCLAHTRAIASNGNGREETRERKSQKDEGMD